MGKTGNDTSGISTPKAFVTEVEKYIRNVGSEDWIEVYRRFDRDAGISVLTCALVPEAQVERILGVEEWILDPRHLTPGCVRYANGEVAYFPSGYDEGYEALVREREYHGIKPSNVEVGEEFRLFHNLYHDVRNGKYIKIRNDGFEQDVIRIEDASISIRSVELKQFLAIKEMRLALMFDIRRSFKQSLAELGASEELRTISTPEARYRYEVRNSGFREGSFVRVLGKKLVPGFSKEDSNFWPFNADKGRAGKESARFIVGLDERGREIAMSCEPAGDHYLRPVYFQPEVLNRYYDNPSKYSVEDGYLRCGYLWGLQIDNDSAEYVVAFLGDLGRDLPEGEHHHWRTFNIPPAGPMSETALKRSFMAEFADPKRSDLAFKQAFQMLQDEWQRKLGWPLFKQLNEEDAHCFTSLRIPATSEQNEFDTQVMYLAKVIVDSINEAEVSKHIASSSGQKGISKLEGFLRSKTFPNLDAHVSFLRDVQDLRSSGAAHRKSKNYQKTANRLALDKKDPRAAFADLLYRGTSFLNELRSLAQTAGGPGSRPSFGR